MIVLIAKVNEAVVTRFMPDIKFISDTPNHSTFEISVTNFQKLWSLVKAEGYNCYALFYW